MQALFYGVAVLACPIGMGLMMWMMMRGQRGDSQTKAATPAGGEDRFGEVAALRAEIEQLKAAQAARRTGAQ
jgi:hypothetical protein